MHPVPPPQQKHPSTAKIEGLNTLRTAAISLVFMYHYMVFISHKPTFGWASTIGWTGVDLFFVLSGYLIANQILTGIKNRQRLSLKAFYARRLLRTLPNYYFVLALYALIPAMSGTGVLPPLWKFLTFTQNHNLQPGTAFSHAWSLCIEEQFYLLLPVGALLLSKLKNSVRIAWCSLALLATAGIACRALLWNSYGLEVDEKSAGYYPHIYYSTLCRADEFLPGVAIALLKNSNAPLWQNLMRHGQLIFALGLAAVAAVFYLLLNYYYIEGYGYGFAMTTFGYSLISFSYAILVVAALSPHSTLNRLKVPGAAALAAWSYAIYLSHKSVAMIVQNQLNTHGIQPGSTLSVLTIVAACITTGWLIFRCVETPFMNLRNRHFPTNWRPNPQVQVEIEALMAGKTNQ